MRRSIFCGDLNFPNIFPAFIWIDRDWKERYKTRTLKENGIATLSEPIPDTRARTVDLLKRIVHIHNKNRELLPLVAPTPEPKPEHIEPSPIVPDDVQPAIPAANPEEADENPEEEENPPPVLGGIQLDLDGGLFFGEAKVDDEAVYSQAPLDQLRSCLAELYGQINNFRLLLQMSGAYSNQILGRITNSIYSQTRGRRRRRC